MSRTNKPEKGGRTGLPKGRRDSGEFGAIQQRHTYGRTEKILRRNRKLWTRLLNKIRRRKDNKITNEES